MRGIVDEPPSLFIDQQGITVESTAFETDPASFDDEANFRIPYPSSLKIMVWKPTAVSVSRHYITSYSDDTDKMLNAFPNISEPELSLLVDLLSKIFAYDPVKRITEELVAHPWSPCIDSNIDVRLVWM